MFRSTAPGLIALILALTPAARGDDGGLPPPVVPRGFGVNIHFTDPSPGEMERFAEAGYRFVRMDFAWAAVERTTGVYDFSAYDRLLGHLDRAGARAVLIFDYGNPLYDRGRPPETEAGRAAFARYAAAAARHFRDRKVIWEIWNEPNLAQFWKPEPDADAYARLALAVARAVRAADPDSVVLAPGTSGFPWAFFETVFRSGLLAHVDAVSVHPYRGAPPETAADDFGRLRVLIARHAPPERRGMPVVSSEWGYSTAKGGVSESTQANFLARMWLANLAAGVNLSIFYDWRDDGDDPAENEHRFGTVRRDFTPKPSFLAAKSLIAALDGFSFRHRLKGPGTDDWRFLFQRGDSDALALVSWSAAPNASETLQTPQVRKVPTDDPEFAGLRRLASVRLPAGALVEGAARAAEFDVSVVNPGPGPAHVAVAVGAAKAVELSTAAGRSESRRVSVPGDVLRDVRREVPVRLLWDGTPLPAVAPLTLWRVDPLTIGVAPRGGQLVATIENPARTPFSGRLAALTDGREASATSVDFAEGSDRVQVQLSMPASAHRLALTADGGEAVATLGPRRYEPMAGFPDRAGVPSGFSLVPFVDNAPRPRVPLETVASGPNSPAPFALEVRYDFDRGWHYATAVADRPAPIPAAARALTLWVEPGPSPDHLRSRFRDATSQTFQADLGLLDGSGWRPVRIPLDGSGPGAHWGGAGDGVPHPPLAWDGLVLIDSARRDTPHRGEVRLASPSYEFHD